MKLSNLFFIAIISICPLCHAETSPNSKVQLLYADQLFDDALHEASILEFKRYIFYNPESELVDYAYYKIGQAYYHRKQYDDARQTLNKLMVNFPESPLSLDAKMMLAKTHFEEQNYPAARSELWQLLATESNDRKLRLSVQYMRCWCYLHEKNWYSAIIEFRKISKEEPDSELGKLAENLADTTLSGTRIPRKSPSLAKWMSRFIPGSGQIYAGHFLNGLGATLLNGAFVYLFADSIADERYVDAIGIYLIGARFYFGNIHNAGKFAIDYNRQVDDRLIEEANKLRGKRVKR